MKKLLIIVIAVVIAAWLAMNWVQGQPMFSNPFADQKVAEQLKSDSKALLESGRDAVNSGAEKVKDAINN